MGASLQSGGGGGGRRSNRRNRRGGYVQMAEINVTPFVDVMLVLLIIFMVAAPMLTAGVPIDLPETEAAPLKGQDEPLSISVDKDGRVWLQETEITNLAELAPRLQAIGKRKEDLRLFVRGDDNINYGRVMEVMGLLNAAGFNKVALVTEQKFAN